METVLTLIHSPLVGPLTWSPVAAELRRRNVSVCVPRLEDDGGRDRPFWSQHAETAAQWTNDLPEESALVLVGHSGAGPILPAIRERVARRVVGYVFADAGLPKDERSRLELMEEEDPAFAGRFREYLSGGGVFPAWSEEDLAGVVPDPVVRRRLIGEIRPRDRAFFGEPIPVFAGWPDAPCGYLRFSSAYDVPYRQAREMGWPCRTVEAGHFAMVIDEAGVAEMLLGLVAELTGGASGGTIWGSSAANHQG